MKFSLFYIPANALHSMVATDDKDVIFIVAKDTAWGIEGIPEDKSVMGAHIGENADEKVAGKFKKIADELKEAK